MRALGLAVAVFAFTAEPAQADDLQAFEAARADFEQHRFEAAIRKLSALLSREQGPPTDRVIVTESRKYLGVAYFLLGNPEQAKLQFELLLRLDASYTLDPVRFPAGVYEAFTEVKQRLARDQPAEVENRDPAWCLTAPEGRVVGEAVALPCYARPKRSRWWAAIPFGFGQLYNGHRPLGYTFLGLSVAAAATAMTAGALHAGLQSADPANDEIGSARRRENALRTTNWIALGVLAGLAVVSIVDAQARFNKSPPPPATAPALRKEAQRVLEDAELRATSNRGTPGEDASNP